MGVADTIPGVSGGTVALILGIYERFIGAVSAIGPGFIRAIFTGEFWRRVRIGLTRPGEIGSGTAAEYANHFLFLVFLLLGIGSAIIVGARFIPDLLVRYPEPMNGFFLGLVLASCAIPYRMIRKRQTPQFGIIGLFAVATFFFVSLPVDQSQRASGQVELTFPAPLAGPLTLTPWQEATRFTTDRFKGDQPTREIAFLPVGESVIAAGETSARIEVRAVLAGRVANLNPGELAVATGVPPGTRISQTAPLSGGDDPALWFIFVAGVLAISAMVLPGISGSFVLLMLGLYQYILYNLRALIYDQDPDAVAIIGVFIAALVIGIATFSRFLRWLFKRFHDMTLAALVGIMIGSVRELWPFKSVGRDGAASNALPADIDGTFFAAVGAVILGIVMVIVIEVAGARRAAKAA